MMHYKLLAVFVILCVVQNGLANHENHVNRENHKGNRNAACNSGELNCCNSVHKASSLGVLGILGLLSATVDSLIGVNCTPINVIGASEVTCAQQTVCCTGDMKGLIVIGCSPLAVGA